MNPSRYRSLSSLAAATLAVLAASAPAWGQQEVPVYTPPAYIIITPSGGPNPYLMYVPVTPQPAPPPTAAPPSPAPVTPPPATATAAPSSGPTLSDLGKSLRNYFTQDELDLLFDYMKESVVAAFKGEEVYLPPDLAFKLEVLLARMKKEGVHYMDNLMKQLESDLKRSLKEKLAPPPPPGQEPAVLPPTTPAAAPGASPAPPPPGSSKLPTARKTAKSG